MLRYLNTRITKLESFLSTHKGEIYPEEYYTLQTLKDLRNGIRDGDIPNSRGLTHRDELLRLGK